LHVAVYLLTHLSDSALRQGLVSGRDRERGETAQVLAHIAEFDFRELYRPAAYPSMFAYCVGELGYTEDETARRLQAARVARRFPALFEAVADGRLHLTAVCLIAPHLDCSNVDELIAAAARKTRAQIELILAERFPRPDAPTLLRTLSGPSIPGQAMPATPTLPAPLSDAPASIGAGERSLAPDVANLSCQHGLGHVPLPTPRPRLAPIAPKRFVLQLTIEQQVHEKLCHLQDLASHRIPTGDLASVLELALDLAIAELEKRKFAASDAPRASRSAGRRPRSIPAAVSRAVWKRDGGRCTFVSETGKRCEARRCLEFDHVLPVARGGRSTVANLRMRCSAHNQYEAEQAFGPEFMRAKRREAREARAAAGAQAAAESKARAQAAAEAGARALEEIPWLRAMAEANADPPRAPAP
jgi:5-methylcytosine-specific restriction endonuclease McrA